ncbi:MAG TPA: potassium channel family protein [Bryobacteraceae bacterium]
MTTFIHQASAAVLLIAFTLWLECGGLAVLIVWVRPVLAESNIHELGPWHAAVLVVRFSAALIVLQGLEILVWASFYRWICLPSWESAFYFSTTSYSTIGSSDVTLPSQWRMLGPLESIIGVLMAGISVSILFAIVMRLSNVRVTVRR